MSDYRRPQERFGDLTATGLVGTECAQRVREWAYQNKRIVVSEDRTRKEKYCESTKNCLSTEKSEENVFQKYEKYFLTFGARIEKWPDEAFKIESRRSVRDRVNDAIRSRVECPKYIKSKIVAMTSLRVALQKIRDGSFEMPQELEEMYVNGWETSCDVILLKEIERFGFEYYEGYIENDCIKYVLSKIMKLSYEQQINFLKQRCSILLKCLVLRKL
ncbi:hypothetical protein EIN_215070 [Entamoeba invadens IP1]|uniref:Uncharacterized protein n=1 Tax=Entamoeba invadens IP1 TaxID=370355 RepID=A0A0A1U7H2_ENTIV|nr:hypothetical protein EIN_215070 [Entamoeba invadens IP1]ELP90354.1 hypothetical protein EIN_215070 [Entamoeba invadens IP1]|eukprot:XP_004257125.1 hypothetical protein EIN_215070 [Entamoeba invadens IP1]